MNTTAILRWASSQFDQDIQRAINGLTYTNAKPVVAVLQTELQSHPGATTFYFEPGGFIRVE